MSAGDFSGNFNCFFLNCHDEVSEGISDATELLRNGCPGGLKMVWNAQGHTGAGATSS